VRAVLLGLLMIVMVVAMTQALGIAQSAVDVAGGAPPATPTYLLFFYAVFAGPLLQRLGHRLALSRGELLLIYVCMLIAGPIAHPIGIGFLLPHAAAPAYYIGQQSAWEKFWPHLPSWLGPRDLQAVQEFYRGAKGPIPWQAWTAPIIAWGSLLIALFWVTLCINVLLRKQYVEHERLSFPLTAIPLALTEEATPTLRRPLFWLGLMIPLLVQAPFALSKYIPAVPAVQLREVLLLNAGETLPSPWNGLGEIYFSLIFWLVGIVYLIPKEIAFSAWFFYLLALAQNVLAVAIGRADGPPNVYSNDFPALYAQGAGAPLHLRALPCTPRAIICGPSGARYSGVMGRRRPLTTGTSFSRTERPFGAWCSAPCFCCRGFALPECARGWPRFFLLCCSPTFSSSPGCARKQDWAWALFCGPRCWTRPCSRWSAHAASLCPI
jgi:hypothetical protein